MANVKWKRRAVLDNHVPEPVLHLLFTVAVGALGFIGYGYDLTGRRRHASTAIFAVLIALVLATILDFDRSRGSFIRVGEEGMVRLQAAFEQNKPWHSRHGSIPTRTAEPRTGADRLQLRLRCAPPTLPAAAHRGRYAVKAFLDDVHV